MERTRDRVTFALLAALLGAGAFWDGLYSPAQHLLAAGGVALAVLVVPAKGVLTRPQAVAAGLLAVGLAGSWLAGPASAGVAVHGLLVVPGWLLAMLLGRHLAGAWPGGLAEGPPGRPQPGAGLGSVLGRVWSITGFGMAFGGIAAMSYLPEHHSGRLASFLAYPVAVGVLGLLGAAGSLPLLVRTTGNGTLATRLAAASLLYGNLLAVWLSGSRGVWAVGVLLAAYLAWALAGLSRQDWGLAAFALILSFAAALWSGPAVAGRSVAIALLPCIAGCLTMLGAAGFQWTCSRAVRPGAARAAGPTVDRPPVRTLHWAGVASVAVPVALTALAAAMAPGWRWFLGRVAVSPLAEGAAVERMAFLRDGFRMALVHPWGAGYRAWTALHLQGASYGYYSAEAHSAAVDMALAFGWAGAAGFLMLLGHLLWSLRDGRGWGPERASALAALGALGLHALLDWDLSYAVFAIPLWVGFGSVGAWPAGGAGESVQPSGPLGPVPPIVRIPEAAVRVLAAATLCGTLLLGAADLLTEAARRAHDGGDPGRALQHARVAVALNPWNDHGHAAAGLAASQLGRREEALAAFARARTLAPLEPWHAEVHARELAAAGRWLEAAAAYRTEVRLWPWHVPAYESALDALVDMSFRAALRGDPVLAAQLSATGREILQALDSQKAREPARSPRPPMPMDTAALVRARAFFSRAGE